MTTLKKCLSCVDWKLISSNLWILYLKVKGCVTTPYGLYWVPFHAKLRYCMITGLKDTFNFKTFNNILFLQYLWKLQEE